MNKTHISISYIRVLYDYFNSIQADELTNIELNLENKSASNFNNVLNQISGTFFV